jgi:hypothetical protein
LYNNRAPDDQRWVFVAIERSLVSIYLRLRILLRRGRKEVKRQCHGRTSTQAGVIGGRVVSLCNDNLRNGSAVIVMSGVAAMVTASAGSVVCA